MWQNDIIFATSTMDALEHLLREVTKLHTASVSKLWIDRWEKWNDITFDAEQR